jgi:Zn-dependent metalloprotease
MTHGVTSVTAALEYAAESGALNESYSDVFGKLIAFKYTKTSDWKIGRDLFKDGRSFVRDLENPEIGHMRDYLYKGENCHRFNDFCGVHKNSGIPNVVAVRIAAKLGIEKLGRIYYLTLTQLLRSNSTFLDARAQTEAACATLYGSGNADCSAIGAAYDSAGIMPAGTAQ